MYKNFNIIIIITTYLFITGCGFKPIYKIDTNKMDNGNYSIEIINDVSREVIDEVKNSIFTPDNASYTAYLTIGEDLTPLIINTNGTVAKYRIEVTIDFELVENNTNEIKTSGKTRGFAQYDVGASEISNEDTRKSMLKTATKNALQIMISKIQSSTAKLNDN